MHTAPRFFVFVSLLALAGTHCAPAAGDVPDPSPTTTSEATRDLSALSHRGCPSCHDGSRGGLAGADIPIAGTHAFPPNLTPDPSTGLGTWSDDEIARAIREGLDDQGETLCDVMPRFADIEDTEMKSIVGELRALTPVVHQSPDSDCGASDP